MDGLSLSSLPRESRMVFTVFGLRLLPPDHEQSKIFPGPQYEKFELGWSAVQCFNHKG